jgi:iron(III) transport system substrate-binding protein
VASSAKHIDAANKLIAYMLTSESQGWYSEVNNEYPVVPDVPASVVLKSWGDFKADSVNLSLLGANNRTAVQLMDRANWK